MAAMHSSRLVTNLSLALSLLWAVPAAANPIGDVVGELTTVIGLGKVIGTQGEKPAVRGALVRAGDRIETASGGHVHIRFVDGGMVSVRPLSRLRIEDYRNRDAQGPAAIKFNLEDGVIRSVTGHWGEANRDRFRLNTPVAAIGIKGTDFVVKANSTSTLASVNSGAIVMAPLDGACAAGLGPCTGVRSELLTADMRGKMLEYREQGDTSVPRLIPYADLLARSNSAQNPTDPDKSQPVNAGRTSLGNADMGSKITDNQLVEANLIDMPAITPVTSPPAGLPLVWLHNAALWNVPANTISTRFDEASAAGRKAVVGNFFINLYRDESIQKTFAPPALSASFSLQGASANYTQPVAYARPVEVVTVTGGSLTANFASNTLSTQLNMVSPTLGQTSFAASAGITPQGTFSANTAGQKLAGTFSTDASQAGYLFEQKLSGGTVSGLTLWGR